MAFRPGSDRLTARSKALGFREHTDDRCHQAGPFLDSSATASYPSQRPSALAIFVRFVGVLERALVASATLEVDSIGALPLKLR